MSKQTGQLKGLSPEEVLSSRARHGSNHLYVKPKRYLLLILLDVAKEPIFLLLLLACGLYFAIGDVMEAWLMVGSVAFVIIIEIIQEYRSEKALTALRSFSQPLARVIRDAEKKEIPAEELVVGDLLVFEEGERLAADGELVQQGDLTVDEAVLTGESLPVDKNARDGENKLYQGTTVASGQGIARVSAVGAHTELGKLGKSIESIETSPTPLQMQIDRFVRQMLIAGLIAFLIVFSINYVYAGSFLSALLFSLAFALALVPEEIPVAFTTFMALGAYRMTRQQVLVKQPKTVESLGAATVICLDKTGTITENRMSVAETSDFSGAGHVLEYAMWASEPEPFDAMEKAIHEAYGRSASPDRREAFELVHEYPLSGVPPMMTHVHVPDGNMDSVRIVAAKGAVERMVRVCRLDAAQRKEVMRRTREMAGKGFRVLGVASATWDKAAYPDDQDAFPWTFEGLIALHDPPKPNIRQVIGRFYEAHIDVKMITGDYPETAMHIARESGIRVD
ncbi:MAG: HAD-IC family P-type ATPase, partial [Saprospiraceae bacterium]|nr:HAD-IC family P-type ATPase [Saprospiraceae bacterium]